ncbi:MAG: PEGA domain-containing protein, partial [Myxococcales bacterium]
ASNGFFDLAVDPALRVAPLARGYALACGQACVVLGDRSVEGSRTGPLGLGPDDRSKALGTTGLTFAGSRDGWQWLGWGSAPGAGAAPPVLTTLSADTLRIGEVGEVQGEGWPAMAAPGPAGSLAGPTVLAWRPLDGVGPVHVFEVSAWGAGAITFTVPRTVYSGPGWLYVLVDGVPSEGRRLTLARAEAARPCAVGGQCASGYCVDEVCCDQPCAEACRACSAQAKGKGLDGVCEPIVADGPPRQSGCLNPNQTECGPTGQCDGNGACRLPGLETPCTGVPGGVCLGGVCGVPPPATCDPVDNTVVSVNGRRPCGGYLCRDGDCPASCASHLDCTAGFGCSAARRCEPPEPPAVVERASCAVGPAPAGRGGALLALLLGAALGARRRAASRRAGHRGRAVVALLAALAPAARAEGAPTPGAAASAPPPDARREEARDLLRKGLALYRAGEVPRALEFFLRSRGVFAAKGNTINAAACLRDLGRLDEALELYEEAVTSFSASFDEDDRVAVPAAMAELRGRVGQLFVSASTTGAVVIDGRERGRLPLSAPIRLLPGTHVVRVLKDGYRTFEASTRVQVGQTATLDARLEPLASAGGLRVEDPALVGAEVLVDGVVVGTAPWEGTLAPGPHVVWSRQGGRGSAPTLAQVLQGQTALLRLRSARLAAAPRVSVRPATAGLRLDDVPLGPGRWDGALPPGTYRLTAAEEGYLTATREVTTADDIEAPAEVVIELRVDENHPRWPRRPAGTLSVGLVAMWGLGPGLRGGASDSCAAGSCRGPGLAHGPAAGLRGAYAFPSGLSVELAAGVASFGATVRRELPRQPAGGPVADVRYRLADDVRLRGYWLAAGGLARELAAHGRSE